MPPLSIIQQPFRLLALISIFFSLTATTAQGAPPAGRNTGLGLSFGSPFGGLSAYSRLDEKHFLQGELGFLSWNAAPGFGASYFSLKGDYGIYVPSMFADSPAVSPYYGFGFIVWNDSYSGYWVDHDVDSGFGIGGRIPFGLQFHIPDAPLQLAVELAPTVVAGPLTLTLINASLAFRFMF